MATRYTTRRLFAWMSAVAVVAAGVGFAWREFEREMARINLVYDWQDKFDRGEVTRDEAREKVGDLVDKW